MQDILINHNYFAGNKSCTIAFSLDLLNFITLLQSRSYTALDGFVKTLRGKISWIIFLSRLYILYIAMQPNLKESVYVPLSVAVQEYRAIKFHLDNLTMFRGLKKTSNQCIACPRVGLTL